MSAEGFRARARPEPPLAQILVVVANTLERSWRTDAEKGFLSTAVAQVLVDPKPRAKALQRGPHDERSSVHARSPRKSEARGSHERDRRRFGLRLPPTLLPTPLLRGTTRCLPGIVRQTRRRIISRATVHPRSRGRSRSGRAAGRDTLRGARSPLAEPGRYRAIGTRTALGVGQHGRARKRPTDRTLPNGGRTSPRAPRAVSTAAGGRRRIGAEPHIANGSTWRKGTRSRFRDPASRKRSPARSVRLVGAIRQPARRSRRRTRGELSFLLKRPSIPGTRMARR